MILLGPEQWVTEKGWFWVGVVSRWSLGACKNGVVCLRIHGTAFQLFCSPSVHAATLLSCWRVHGCTSALSPAQQGGPSTLGDPLSTCSPLKALLGHPTPCKCSPELPRLRAICHSTAKDTGSQREQIASRSHRSFPLNRDSCHKALMGSKICNCVYRPGQGLHSCIPWESHSSFVPSMLSPWHKGTVGC